MQASMRPYVTAGVALAAASVVAVTPVAERLPEVGIFSPALRLVDASSLLNVPFNLFQDIVNIPGTELGAINQFGNANLFGGTLYTASATNIFGEDPGDPGRFMSVVDILAPFKALSGQGMGELGAPDMGLGIDQAAAASGQLGLSQQIALLIDAELPASATSDADWSAPLAPISEITGLSGVDRSIWSLAILSGLQRFPLLNNFFQVPVSQLMSGYNFGTVVDPSPGIGPDGAVPGDAIFGFPGTHPSIGDLGFGTVGGTAMGQSLNVAGNPINLMPWSNLDFKLDLSAPFQNFFNSLQAPFDPTAFDIPTFADLARSLQTFAAGAVVLLDPFVPGSPFCPDTCGLAGPLTQQGLVQGIANLFPGNTSVDHWLDLTSNVTPDYPFGMANTATANGIDFAKMFLTGGPQSNLDIGNPLPNMIPLDGMFAPYTPSPFEVSPAIQSLIDFSQASGIQAFAQQLAALNGFTPAFGDVTEYLTPSGAIVPAVAADSAAAGSTAAMSTWLADLFPASTAAGSTADLSAMTAEMNTLFAELMNPAGMSTLFTDLMNPADWASIF